MRTAFSLLELVIVVAIIIVLIAMLLAAINIVRTHAKRAATAQVVAELCVALENYRGEDMRHRFPLPDPSVTPFIRHDPAYNAMVDPSLRKSGPSPTLPLDLLAECGFSWRNDQLGHDGEGANCLIDPWRRPYRYVVDDGSAPTVQKPAPLADWNSSNARPFAYVWSLGAPKDASDAAPASAARWIYRRDGRVR